MRYLIILLLLLPSALAISTDLQEQYSPRETVLIQIFGNVLEPISLQDVEFKRNNVQVAFEYDVRKIGPNYFIYFVIDNAQNNYTLLINDVLTTVDGQPKRIDFMQNFSVLGDAAPYNFRPGFINTKEDFRVDVFSYIDLPIEIEISHLGNFTLSSGENQVGFEIEDFENGFNLINIGEYEFILDKIPIEEPTERKISFYPLRIDSVVLYNNAEIYPIRIINVYNEDLTDLSLIYDSNYFDVFPREIGILKANSSLDINLSVKRRTDFSDTIIARVGNEQVELPFSIKYTNDSAQVSTPYLEENFTEGYYCQELSGKSCPSPNVCSGDLVESLDSNYCCIGTCSEPSSTSYSWIGYLIGAILLVVLVIIGGRYLKTKKMKSSKKSILS